MSEQTLYTDEQLLEQLKGGSHAAFNEIYELYWERMSLYTLKVIRNEEEARDIVQEVFVSIWKRRETLVIHGPLVAYLLRSVRNLSLRYIERNINKTHFLDSLSEHLRHLDLSAVNTLELQELERRLAAAVLKLPSKMQEVYRLSRQENLSYREIAEQLGIAETTVKKQVSNALHFIRADLGNLSAMAFILLVFLQD